MRTIDEVIKALETVAEIIQKQQEQIDYLSSSIKYFKEREEYEQYPD